DGVVDSNDVLVNPRTGEPFPGNRIPLADFDPVARALLDEFVPVGNIGDGQFISSPTGTERDDQFTLRFDQTLPRNQTLTAYYFFDDEKLVSPFARFQAGGANVPGF